VKGCELELTVWIANQFGGSRSGEAKPARQEAEANKSSQL